MKKNYDTPDIFVIGILKADVLFASESDPNLNDIYGEEAWSI